MLLILVPFPRTTAEKTWTEQVKKLQLLTFFSTERAFSLGISTSQHARCRLPLTLTRPPSTKMTPRTLEANCHVEN